MAPPSKRGSPDTRGRVQPLPFDALYEILLRLPVKELCRLRVVCKPWRSLLSDPRFVAAHWARHPGPLIVAGYDPADPRRILCDIMDLSGRVVKRIRSTGEGIGKDVVMKSHLDLIYTIRWMSEGDRFLDPATGATFPLPQGFAEEHEELGLDIMDYGAAFDFGKVASTGEYKTRCFVCLTTPFLTRTLSSSARSSLLIQQGCSVESKKRLSRSC